jgi:hypothetical protein
MKQWFPEALVGCAILMVVSYGFAQTWNPVSKNSGLFSVASSADGQKMLTVTSGTVEWVSTNSGSTWQQKSTAYPISLVASSAAGNNLVGVWAARASGYVYVSTNSGDTWTRTSSPLGDWRSCSCSADGTKLVAAIYGGQIYSSTNSGTTWQTNNAPKKNWTGLASSADGTKLAAVVGITADVIYTSTNSGMTWMPSSSPTNSWTSIASSADGIELVATGTGGTCISYDSGNSWTVSDIAVAYAFADVCVASSADGSKLLICTVVYNGSYFYEVYSSTNFGSIWTTNDIPINFSGGGGCAVALSADGNKSVIVGSAQYIYALYNPPAPQLNLAPSNSNLALSWLIPSTNFVVQQSPDLISWSSITDAPTLNLTNLNNELSLSPTNGSGFFRLMSQ